MDATAHVRIALSGDSATARRDLDAAFDSSRWRHGVGPEHTGQYDVASLPLWQVFADLQTGWVALRDKVGGGDPALVDAVWVSVTPAFDASRISTTPPAVATALRAARAAKRPEGGHPCAVMRFDMRIGIDGPRGTRDADHLRGRFDRDLARLATVRKGVNWGHRGAYLPAWDALHALTLMSLVVQDHYSTAAPAAMLDHFWTLLRRT